MRFLWLYHSEFPSFRAQNVQISAAASALAELGHEVTILARQSKSKQGHQPSPSVKTILCPTRHPGLHSVWFQKQVRRWADGPTGFVIARDIRRLYKSLESLLHHQIVIEAHDLPSFRKPELYKIEQAVLSNAQVLICNSAGTLNQWKSTHRLSIPSMVIHNATSVIPTLGTITCCLRSIGSLHSYKGHPQAILALSNFPHSIEWIGDNHLPKLTLPSRHHHRNATLEWQGLLHSAQTLLLVLADNSFGRSSSPLKLWDYLATDRPLILPDLTSIRSPTEHISRQGLFFYQPGNPNSLLSAAKHSWEAPRRQPYVRSWGHRAKEYLLFLEHQ